MSQRKSTLEGVWKHFARRQQACLKGLHLPSEAEILLGMPFFTGSLEEDLAEYAASASRILAHGSDDPRIHAVLVVLGDLSVEPTRPSVERLRAALEGALSVKKIHLERHLLRCRIYMAAFGDPEASAALAMDAVTLACVLPRYSPRSADFAFRSLELLAIAAGQDGFRYLGGHLQPGGRLVDHNQPSDRFEGNANFRRRIEEALERQREWELAQLQAPKSDETAKAEVSIQADDKQSDDGLQRVVIAEIGNPRSTEGKKVALEFAEVLAKPLPLTPLLDVNSVHRQLAAEFPHAEQVAHRILNEVAARSYAWVRPTVLVGPIGSGKSSFGRRLFELLGVKYDVIPLGGMADSAIMGTARRWSTGEPSFAVAAIQRHKVAGPAIILDEAEKVGSGRHNGHPHDALLPLMEGTSAKAYHDPYLQAPVDLSYISWLLTANSTTDLSGPLKDRCRVITFPAPAIEHLEIYVGQLVPAILRERGLDGRWLQWLHAFEMSSLLNWTDGSLRTLRKMIESIVDEREARDRTRPN